MVLLDIIFDKNWGNKEIKKIFGRIGLWGGGCHILESHSANNFLISLFLQFLSSIISRSTGYLMLLTNVLHYKRLSNILEKLNEIGCCARMTANTHDHQQVQESLDNKCRSHKHRRADKMGGWTLWNALSPCFAVDNKHDSTPIKCLVTSWQCCKDRYFFFIKFWCHP